MIRAILTYVVANLFYSSSEIKGDKAEAAVEKIIFWFVIGGIALAFYLLSLVPSARAHMEDHSGCVTVPKFSVIKLNAIPYYEGVSDDGRDYIVQFNLRGLNYADLEYRFILAPPAQRKGGKATPVHWNPVGVWVDSDDRRGWDDWWIDPRGNGNCKDLIHLKWAKDLEHWVLWIAHHDEREAKAVAELQEAIDAATNRLEAIGKDLDASHR